MPVPLLTLLKLVLLAALYLFLFRAIRVVVADLYGPSSRKRKSPPPRPAMASPSASGRGRKLPKELVVHPPEGAPEVVPLRTERIVVGRGGRANVIVDDVYVSDEHAEVLRDDGGWTVRDLGSTNGTFLNGAKVSQPTALTAGDQIRVGKTRLELRR